MVSFDTVGAFHTAVVSRVPLTFPKITIRNPASPTNGEGGWLHLIGIVSLRHCYKVNTDVIVQ